MNVLPSCMPAHQLCAVSSEARGGVKSLETEVTDGCELPCRCWELNSGPL